MTSDRQRRVLYDFDDNHLMGLESGDQLTMTLAQMSQEQQYERGVSLLEEYWEQHAHLDHDGWLRRHTYNAKASIMLGSGRPAEALDEYRALEQFGLYAWYEPLELAAGMGRCLVELGRHAQAIDVVQRALDDGEPERYESVALMLLSWLGRAYTALGQPVPARYLPLLQRCATYHKVEIPAGLLDDPARLSDAIAAVQRLERRADE